LKRLRRMLGIRAGKSRGGGWKSVTRDS